MAKKRVQGLSVTEIQAGRKLLANAQGFKLTYVGQDNRGLPKYRLTLLQPGVLPVGSSCT